MIQYTNYLLLLNSIRCTWVLLLRLCGGKHPLLLVMVVIVETQQGFEAIKCLGLR